MSISLFSRRRDYDADILSGLFRRSWVTGRDGTIVQSGGTGGSALCPWTGSVIASGGICGFTLPVPGGGSIRFCHAQGQRINLFLNSNAPATQDISVGTGSVAVSAIGSGYTLTTSAGTATISGQGAVTMGTTQVITVTGAGTITFTVAGTPVSGYVNVEQNAFAGVKIITAGTSVTRTADNIAWTTPAALSATQGELYALAVPYGWSVAAGTASPAGANAYIVGTSEAAGMGIYKSAATLRTSKTDAGGSQLASLASAPAESSGVIGMKSSKWDSVALRLYSGSSLSASDTTLTAPWSGVDSVGLASTSAGGSHWFGAVAALYDPKPTDASRAALARYFNGRVQTILA